MRVDFVCNKFSIAIVVIYAPKGERHFNKLFVPRNQFKKLELGGNERPFVEAQDRITIK